MLMPVCPDSHIAQLGLISHDSGASDSSRASEYVYGVADTATEVSDEMREVMRDNSHAAEKLITTKVRD
jgi:hypothetical protein